MKRHIKIIYLFVLIIINLVVLNLNKSTYAQQDPEWKYFMEIGSGYGCAPDYWNYYKVCCMQYKLSPKN